MDCRESKLQRRASVLVLDYVELPHARSDLCCGAVFVFVAEVLTAECDALHASEETDLWRINVLVASTRYPVASAVKFL